MRAVVYRQSTDSPDDLSDESLALRCCIVLACAEGARRRDEIGAEAGCNPVTVTKWGGVDRTVAR